MEILTNFDHTKLTPEIMSEVEERMANPEFILENVARASKAAKGLYHWVFALKNYYYIYQETNPKRDALLNAERQKKLKEHEISVKKNELEDLELNMVKLKKEHEVKELEIR
mmetsp:Transcript_21854/g.21024  ORF Transcript_21854/g.21024 Transcript_21854/m.21024 type:complete len:112 (+) Transcript_21854:3411-3746(+)